MQHETPLTPALSPSDGEREKISHVRSRSLNGEAARDRRSDSLSPSDGERVRVRGSSDRILTAKSLNRSDRSARFNASPPSAPFRFALRSGSFTASKQSRKFLMIGELSCRLHATAVCTGGRPGGSGRKTSPGRFTSASVSVVGATPKPAEMSHILICTFCAYCVGCVSAPALAHAARNGS